jgi:CHAT domain-containing protein
VLLFTVTLPAQESSAARLASIRALLDDGRYSEAEVAATGLHASLGADRRGVEPAVVDRLVQALVANGKAADAHTRTLARQAVAARETAVPPDPDALATTLRNFGDVLFERGDYQQAPEQFQRALALRERVPDHNPLDLAEDLDHLARALMWVDRADAAALANDRAFAIKEEAVGDDVRLAQSLELRAQLDQRLGRYVEARQALERAVRLRRNAPEHPALAMTLTLLGQQSWLEGDLEESKRASGEALAIARRTLRDGHPEIATYLRNLAVPVADLGDLATSRELRTRALAIAEQSLGADHPSVGVLLNDLAVNMTQEGDYAAARLWYERALTVYSGRLGSDNTLTITVVYNLAVINATLTNFSEARYRFTQVIAAWERVFNPDHPNVARGLTAFGEMLTAQGLDAEAKPLLERALAIRERATVRNQRDLARTLIALATAEARLGNYVRALDLSTRVTRSFEESNDADARRAADALLQHGSFQAHVGNFAAARITYTRALAILRQMLGANHLSVVNAQLALAEVLALERRPAEAATGALEAEDTARNSLRLTLRYLPERQAVTYGARRPRTLDVALLVVGDAPTMSASVLDRVILSRSLVLDEMAGRHREAHEATVSDVAPLWSNLIAARQRLANLVVRGPGQQRPEQYLSTLEDARREKDLAERALAEQSAAFSAELKKPSVGLPQVRAALPHHSALVSIVRYEAIDRASALSAGREPKPAAARPYPAPTIPSYIAFVLGQDKSDPIPVPLGAAAAIDELIARWRTETVAWLSRAPGEPNTSERTLRSIGDLLRRRTWDLIAAHLEGVEQVFVVPDGALNLLPLAALPVGKTEYLLERGPTIHYLSAERDLVTTNSAAIGAGLLALGGPSFEDASLFTKLVKPSVGTSRSGVRARQEDRSAFGGAESAPSMSESFRGAVSDCLSFQSMTFGPLPASRREANGVAGLWKEFGPVTTEASSSPRVLVGRSADERSFKQLSPGHRVLHLATHGFFLGGECNSALEGTRSVGGLVTGKKPKPVNTKSPVAKAASSPKGVGTNGENPLLLSGLALAGANRRAAATGDEEDGILTAEEVASLDLSGVEWAVLSACDTGLGEIKAGEGVFGLRRAFQIAGAHTVIMSLWQVEDRAAMTWMRALYEGRLARKLDTAAAVREASLSVLRQRRARGQSTHPFYWAGFVASGDWR